MRPRRQIPQSNRHEEEDAVLLRRSAVPPSQDSTGSLKYWRILWRRKGTIILPAILGGLLALLITVPQNRIYQARSTLEFKNVNAEFMGRGGVSPYGDSSGSSADIRTQIQILESETLVDRVLEKLDWSPPRRQGDTDSSLLARWRRALRIDSGENDRAPRLRALDYAREHIEINAADETRIVEVRVDSPDPVVAAEFVNTLSDEFVTLSLEARWTSAERTAEELVSQLEDTKAQLHRAEHELQESAGRVGLLDTGDQPDVAKEKLAQLLEELSRAEAERIRMQSRFELLAAYPPEILPDVVDDATLRNYQQTLTDLRGQEAELATTYNSAHPELKRVRAQIKAVEDAFTETRDAVLGRIESEYKQAVRSEEVIREQFSRQARLVADQAEKATEYNIHRRDVDLLREHYQAMLDRVRTASVSSALRDSDIRVLDPARIPKGPYKPPIVLSGILGLLSGGFAGIVLVILREREDRFLKAPGDAVLSLSLPELGIVPDARKDRFNAYSLLHWPRKALGAAGEEEAAPEVTGEIRHQNSRLKEPGKAIIKRHEDDMVELVTLKDGASAITQGFHSTLASILLRRKNEQALRIISLTSAQPSEGKTTIASNLAIALAKLGQGVLLIDGDLRKPRLHQVFGVPRKIGLGEYLASDCTAEDVIEDYVHDTVVSGLHVLPAGADSPEFTKLLHSSRMSGLLRQCRKRYDMVIIDTPPERDVPDARIIGRMSDAVILVVRSGHTERETAIATCDRLRRDGCPVLGTILNQWNPKRAGVW